MTAPDLIARRAALGLSQQGLASALGVNVGTVSRWERGQRAIPPMLALALATLERRVLACCQEG